MGWSRQDLNPVAMSLPSRGSAESMAIPPNSLVKPSQGWSRLVKVGQTTFSLSLMFIEKPSGLVMNQKSRFSCLLKASLSPLTPANIGVKAACRKTLTYEKIQFGSDKLGDGQVLFAAAYFDWTAFQSGCPR
jgi:hypothetical protein